jgi:hypothetical protein
MARLSVIAAVAASVLVVGVAAADAVLVTPDPVLVGPKDDESPVATAGGDYLAFVRQRPGTNFKFDMWVRHGSDPLVKVNRHGQAFRGGIGGNELVYGLYYHHHATIRFYNLVTHARRRPPRGVNYPGAASFGPSISGHWLLFGRERKNRDRLILRNMTRRPGTSRVLEEVTTRHHIFEPGQVNGDWAAWTRFTIRHGVFRASVRDYRISTKTTSAISRPSGTDQYAASVDPQGRVFYVRSGQGCGKHVVIREHLPGGGDTALATLPAGYDIFTTFAVDEGGGQTTVYFDRIKCTSNQADIYKVQVP